WYYNLAQVGPNLQLIPIPRQVFDAARKFYASGGLGESPSGELLYGDWDDDGGAWIVALSADGGRRFMPGSGFVAAWAIFANGGVLRSAEVSGACALERVFTDGRTHTLAVVDGDLCRTGADGRAVIGRDGLVYYTTYSSKAVFRVAADGGIYRM